MQATTTNLKAATAVSAGPAMTPPSMHVVYHAFLTTPVGTANVVIEGSNDPRVISDAANAQWVTLASPALAAGTPSLGAAIDAPWAYMRARVTGVTGGASVNVVFSS